MFMTDDITPLLDGLNAAQREAVTKPPVPVLVLAGAGSGKTRVLVHRIAWLIEVERVSPFGILAVTFTNKAAAEMRSRVEQLLQIPARGLWMGTFHGIAHRLLRAHWQEAGLPQNFQIIDSDDQLRLVKRVIRGLELDETRWPPKQAQWYINARKDEGVRPAHLEDSGDPVDRQLVRIYTAYQAACEKEGAVDFAELLLRALELLRDTPHLLHHYRERFRHILVDEFQDTNTLQYAWLRLLAGETNPVFAVGDDDQSIYGWRGARVEHIQRFTRDFPNAELVRLEQNYRSTGNILAAANHLIAHNEGRLGKNLWTEGGAGEPILFYTAFDEFDEARFVAEQVRRWTEQGRARSEVAVLYRSNAQSRVFEETFIAEQIPYRVYGGLRFFERAEIKDALAYLRLAANPADDAAFERIVNTPPRGIGERTLAALRERARARNTTLWQASLELDSVAPRARNALAAFRSLIEGIALELEGLELEAQVRQAIERSGLVEHYGRESGERGQARIENLEELVNAARGFRPEAAAMAPGEPEVPEEPLAAFLAHAALEAGERQAGPSEDCVHLMTLHSAKGLEFPLVFIAGLEEGLFPHQMSLQEPGRLEEERRLCYVGMTRARRLLYLSCAESRRLHGSDSPQLPSRFLREIPGELIEEVRPRVQVSRPVHRGPAPEPGAAGAGLGLGQRVRHARFGEGVVLNYEGAGAAARVQVNFESAGSKWLVLAYAGLEIL